MLLNLIKKYIFSLKKIKVSEDRLVDWLREEITDLVNKDSRKTTQICVGVYFICPNGTEFVYQFLFENLNSQIFKFPLDWDEFKISIRVLDYLFYKRDVGLDFLDHKTSLLGFSDMSSLAKKAKNPYKVFHPQAETYFLLVPHQVLLSKQNYLLKKLGSTRLITQLATS